jgi:hypothetical protein
MGCDTTSSCRTSLTQRPLSPNTTLINNHVIIITGNPPTLLILPHPPETINQCTGSGVDKKRASTHSVSQLE